MSTNRPLVLSDIEPYFDNANRFNGSAYWNAFLDSLNDFITGLTSHPSPGKISNTKPVREHALLTGVKKANFPWLSRFFPLNAGKSHSMTWTTVVMALALALLVAWIVTFFFQLAFLSTVVIPLLNVAVLLGRGADIWFGEEHDMSRRFQVAQENRAYKRTYGESRYRYAFVRKEFKAPEAENQEEEKQLLDEVKNGEEKGVFFYFQEDAVLIFIEKRFNAEKKNWEIELIKRKELNQEKDIEKRALNALDACKENDDLSAGDLKHLSTLLGKGPENDAWLSSFIWGAVLIGIGLVLSAFYLFSPPIGSALYTVLSLMNCLAFLAISEKFYQEIRLGYFSKLFTDDERWQTRLKRGIDYLFSLVKLVGTILLAIVYFALPMFPVSLFWAAIGLYLAHFVYVAAIKPLLHWLLIPSIPDPPDMRSDLGDSMDEDRRSMDVELGSRRQTESDESLSLCDEKKQFFQPLNPRSGADEGKTSKTTEILLLQKQGQQKDLNRANPPESQNTPQSTLTQTNQRVKSF